MLFPYNVNANNRLGVNVVLFEEVVGDYRGRVRFESCAKTRKMHAPVKRKVLMSSRSSQVAMNFWPRPMVYLPFETPSNSSSSSWEMHYERNISFLGSVANQQSLLTLDGKYISIARMPTSFGRGGTSYSWALPLRGMVMVIFE